MFEFAALTYGVLASFVMTSMRRNRRDARTNSATLTLFGWALMAFSVSSSTILFGYAGYATLVGGGVATAA